jgi:hypothetical protein
VIRGVVGFVFLFFWVLVWAFAHGVPSYSFSREPLDPFLTKWRGTSFEEKAVHGVAAGSG